MNENPNIHGNTNVGRYVGGALLAGLLLKLPIVRALVGLIIGTALALIRPVLLVFGLVKAAEFFPSLFSRPAAHQTQNP